MVWTPSWSKKIFWWVPPERRKNEDPQIWEREGEKNTLARNPEGKGALKLLLALVDRKVTWRHLRPKEEQKKNIRKILPIMEF